MSDCLSSKNKLMNQIFSFIFAWLHPETLTESAFLQMKAENWVHVKRQLDSQRATIFICYLFVEAAANWNGFMLRYIITVSEAIVITERTLNI